MSTRTERRPWDLLPSTIAILQLLSHRLPVTTCSSAHHQPNGQREWRERVLGDCGFEKDVVETQKLGRARRAATAAQQACPSLVRVVGASAAGAECFNYGQIWPGGPAWPLAADVYVTMAV